MSDAESFKHINTKCQHVAALIREAQEAHDPDQTARLYQEARAQTEIVSAIVREKLAAMSRVAAPVDRAA